MIDSAELAPPAPRRTSTRARPRLAARTPAAPPRPRAVDAVAAAAGIGLGITIALGVTAETWSGLSAPGGWVTAAGRMTGLIGTYMMLMVVLLAGRLPVVERTLGQDRLTFWHRRLAPWSLVLIAAHGVLITIGYAEQAKTGMWHQFAQLITSYPGILTATVAFALLVMAGLTSAKIARRRMKYETWWVVHLYTYLALALSFSHQLASGAAFVGHPVARIFWTALWIATAGTVLLYRILFPLWRTALHRLQVVSVQPVAPGVVSVVVRGHFLNRLPLSGGQFLQWRVLKPGLWWQAHPYSISAVAQPPYLRFTVKALGDHSASLAALTPGTRLAIEGPYGAFTADQRETDRVILIGAGVGITPLRAMLQDLPREVDVTLVVRAHAEEDLVLRDELRSFMNRRRGDLLELIGPRSRFPVMEVTLARHVPDIAVGDVYICGPTGFTADMIAAVRALGTPASRIHHESFAF